MTHTNKSPEIPGRFKSLAESLEHTLYAVRVTGTHTLCSHWDFGGTLSGREVDYLIQHEWAEDVVWRRSKIGIQLGKTNIGD